MANRKRSVHRGAFRHRTEYQSDRQADQCRRPDLSGRHRGNPGKAGSDMAVTKTHPIKSTLKAAIDYICNPDKTDGKLLVSSFGCAAEAADIEFE